MAEKELVSPVERGRVIEEADGGRLGKVI